MSDTEIKMSSPKGNVADSAILDRFQHRVSHIEFVRSVDPMELRTILHLIPEIEVNGA